jgi:hypothetical protein
MASRGADAIERHGCKCLIYLTVKAEGATGHGYALGLVLGLVADSFVRGDGVENASLRASKGEVGDGLVVKAEGVLRGAGALNGQQSGKGGLVG